MSDTENNMEQRTPPKKKFYDQKYCQSWENENEFKGWLSKSSKGVHFFYCKSCRFDGKGGRSEIVRHSLTGKHSKSIKSFKKQQSLFNMPSVSNCTKFENQIKSAELYLCAYGVEHNIPFNSMTHLTKLLPKICPDSKLAENVSCAKTKSEAIMKNVIGKVEKNSLILCLRNNYFSIIADESTDRSIIKHMALVARVVNSDFTTSDYFLSLIPIQSASAETLFNHIIEFFKTNNIDYTKNMIGFASDGANVMMGSNNSVASRFKEKIPHIFIMKCICHSFHLCASYACLMIPSWIEDNVRNIYNFLNTSPKRLACYAEFQSFLDIKPHKLLQPSQTRWLSLLSVIKRLLEQFDSLTLYFTGSALEDQLEKANDIFKKLKDPLFKLYLQFLEYILPVFNDANREMQSESPKIHLLYKRLSCQYHFLLKNYIKPSYLKNTPIEDIQFKNPINFVKNEDIYLGGKVMAYINICGLTPQSKNDFINRCLQFYVEAATQFYKRFPLKKFNVIKQMEFLDPRVIFGNQIQSISSLAINFPNIIKDNHLTDLDSEFRTVQCIEELKRFSLDNETELRVSSFWEKIALMKRGDDTNMFPLLSYFVKGLLCLPHSSANVERTFSMINIIKTKQRNRCLTETLEGLLYAKNAMKNSSCVTFNITKEHFSEMKQTMYDFKQK